MARHTQGQLPNGMVSATQGALRLHLSYQQILRRVQIGEIAGGQTPSGLWYVDPASLDRIAKGRKAATHAA